MPKRVTSPRRKKKMTTKARIKAGSKEAKEWNLRMQEIKRKRREEKRKEEEKKRRKEEKKKRKGSRKMITPVRGKKKMESIPFTHGTVGGVIPH